MSQTVPQEWTRDTPWRQGHILANPAAVELGIVAADRASDACVIVISHDCDVANADLAQEPNIEVIVGRIVGKSDGNFTWAKAPRRLHLELSCADATVTLELYSTEKILVPKHRLLGIYPDCTYLLAPKNLGVLQNWLAVRYRRAAFADLFVSRLSGTGLDKKLSKVLAKYPEISAVYFDVDDGQEINRGDGSPYGLTIVLAYVPGLNAAATSLRADDAEDEIEKLFSDKCFDRSKNIWSEFRLKDCIAISEDDLTISRARLLQQWRLEHLSFKANDGGGTAEHPADSP